MSKRAEIVAELIGGLLIVSGTALLSIPAALIIAGLALVAISNLPGRN